VRPEIPGATIHPIGGEVTQTQLSWSGRKKRKQERGKKSLRIQSSLTAILHFNITCLSLPTHTVPARGAAVRILPSANQLYIPYLLFIEVTCAGVQYCADTGRVPTLLLISTM